MPSKHKNDKLVQLAGFVDREHYDQFIGMFPFYGATTWFIREALHAFIQQVREHPNSGDLQADLKKAIEKMVNETRSAA